jgi:hypothetical protein
VASLRRYSVLAFLSLVACGDPLAPEQAALIPIEPDRGGREPGPEKVSRIDLARADTVMIFCLRPPVGAYHLLQTAALSSR